MITLQEITHRSEFNALEPEWRRLEEAGAAPTVFQSWPWQQAWLDHLGRGTSLRTLVFTRWREVVGIAPLGVRRAHGLPLRRLQWIGTGVSDYLGPLVRPSEDEGVARALAAYLSSRSNRFWDVADLHQLREDSPLPPVFGAPRHAALLPQAVAPYRPLPPTVEELHAQFGKKLRSNLRYARRVLEREHAVEFALAGPDDLETEMTNFFTLHARRWRSRWQPGVLFGGAVQSFHRQAARGLLEQEALRLHVLRLDGTTVASLYCFSFAGVGYYYLGGFDPDLSRYSIGTLLTAHAMESAVREGCWEFDFLRGQEPYKYRWGCVNRTNHRWIQAGRGALAAPSLQFLRWEQRLADRFEAHAHGGH
ncbi:MAG: GNAT family N-acetyltransferase [Armatimonadetes bacterium]|nr:GNAT family N-acetyltransferase [Armatimonadota bacterium]